MLVNNDFHNTFDLFELFKDLTVKDLDVEAAPHSASPKPEVNRASGQNGEVDEPNGKPAEAATKN